MGAPNNITFLFLLIDRDFEIILYVKKIVKILIKIYLFLSTKINVELINDQCHISKMR